MSNCSQLPAWVSYLQALAVPIIAIFIAGFGTWIAMRQMVIAHDKLQNDAFGRQYDKRVAVYEATRKFLASVFRNDIDDNEIRAYGLHTLDAQFLFDNNMCKYLKEVCSHVAALHHAELSIAKIPPDDEGRGAYENMRAGNLDWIIQQGDEATGFSTRFAPFLIQKRVRRSWWLRWPSKE